MIRNTLRKFPIIYSIARFIHIIMENIFMFPKHYMISKSFRNKISSIPSKGNNIWYFCVPQHNNLGDYAQYHCIKKWLHENYNNSNIIEIPSIPVVYDFFGLLKYLKIHIKKDDLIVFQSGYTSSDLHIDEIVHRRVVKNFANKIIFFPQTVKFSSEKEAYKTADIYNRHGNIIFLARDNVSFETAKKIFTRIIVYKMPDIVTTLIGRHIYSGERSGIMFCIRHDGEKKYSDKDINTCFENIMSSEDIWTDTTLGKGEKCSLKILNDKIEQFSKYRVTVTDRFHGMILSLVTSTPVVILKTTDHKVVEGANWFKEILPDYIRIADNLEQASMYVRDILNKECKTINEPYFILKYYNQLKTML